MNNTGTKKTIKKEAKKLISSEPLAETKENNNKKTKKNTYL